ncbi:MAG TPA: hypothetical protein VHO01_13195 [Jatrophihabitans sp.]|nr:hypothetical protein [Jatrophihabitans sp.]
MTQTENSNQTRLAAQPERLNLSATQIIASGLAAISSTVAASYFGVAGTVIGAAFGAVLTVVGNAVYGYSLRRTRNRVLDLAVAQRFNSARAGSSAAAVTAAVTPKPARPPFRWHPKRMALAAAGLFVVIMAATTAFELASGQPLSSTVTGQHGSGLTVGGSQAQHSVPVPSVRPAGSTSSTDRPSSPSPTVTVTVTPSGSQAPSTTPSSPAPSSSGSASGGSSSEPGSSAPTGATTPTPAPTS